MQIHAVGGPSDFMWVYTSYQARKGLHTWTVKTDPHKFCHLKLYHLKFAKKHLFWCGNTEKLKIAVLAFFNQQNCLQ